MLKPRFPIGTMFHTRGKHPRLCTVVVVHTTFSQLTGEAVKLRYVAVHLLMGQQVMDYDVSETTIAMGLVSED